MRKLFSGLIVIVALIILVLLFTPLGLSFWLQHNYGSLLSRINHSNQISVKVTQFNRGWFVSTATLQVTLWGHWTKPQPGMILTKPGEPLQFTLQQHIINGPLVIGKFNQGRQLFFGAAFIYSNIADANFLFNAASLIRFNKTLRNYIYAPMIVIANDQQQYVINNLTSMLTYITRQHRLIADTRVERLQLDTKPLIGIGATEYQPRLMLQNITSRLDLQQKSSLWYGNKSTNIDKFTYLNNQNKPTEINNLFVYATQTATDGTTNIITTAHAAQVTAEKLNLQPVDLKLSLTNIDTNSLNDLVNTAIKLRPLSQINIQQIKMLYLPCVNLIGQGLSIKLNYLNAGTADGAVNAQAQLNFPKQTQGINLPFILASAQGDFNLQMPSAWFTTQLESLYENKKITMDQPNQTPQIAAQQTLQQLLANKKLIQEGQFVKMAITYDKGQLLINGLSPGYQAPSQTQSSAPSPVLLIPSQ
jgi:uncharacterized protein YdgA (DUF945 family)